MEQEIQSWYNFIDNPIKKKTSTALKPESLKMQYKMKMKAKDVREESSGRIHPYLKKGQGTARLPGTTHLKAAKKRKETQQWPSRPAKKKNLRLETRLQASGIYSSGTTDWEKWDIHCQQVLHYS